ncbi:cyclase family protein [Spectribacter hydrogenoxidans]|uniref:Cyclase family protein n=1 Tax=Spectribacter hydrogenoxidans TaxID=3075608 RepID=A0ABU3BVM5_9GAMM|nr:cyclase family protein [Salinisphaera sp. W335]MDT0633343.1 cyclase family protein [Salinisphaera sp. W335]
MRLKTAMWHVALLAGLAIGTATAADNDNEKLPAQAPDAPEWCQSDWGPADEIGAANLLTEERALAAAELVTRGKVYGLGGETSADTPAYGSRSWSMVITQPGQAGGASIGPSDTVFNDDIHMGYVGTGSQIDGLGHIGIDNVYYNCHHASDFVQADGLTALGIHQLPNFVTRGVVLDMTEYYDETIVPEGTAFNREEIEAQAEAQGVEIREGDVVLFHTGWLELVGEDDERYITAEPGLGLEGARYLAERNVVAVGADTWGLEVIPFEEGVGVFEVHQELLARNGIYILENMDSAELVADGVSEFMFVLGAPRFTGGVQAIVNPTAIR